jgi:hypothetical protein
VKENLEKLYGPLYENRYCRININKYICNKFNSSGIATTVNVCRLEWLGDAVRIVDDALLEGKPGGE